MECKNQLFEGGGLRLQVCFAESVRVRMCVHIWLHSYFNLSTNEARFMKFGVRHKMTGGVHRSMTFRQYKRCTPALCHICR